MRTRSLLLNFSSSFLTILLIVHLNLHLSDCKKSSSKSNRYKQLSDAELEALADAWDEDTDLDDIEILDEPEWKRPKPEVKYDEILQGDQMPTGAGVGTMNEQVTIQAKKHQTLMLFVKIIDEDFLKSWKSNEAPKSLATRKFTETVSERWEGMLFNAHLQASRYITEDDQLLFKLDDGAKAFEFRDFLVVQKECYRVTIEQKDYHGKGYVEFNVKSEL